MKFPYPCLWFNGNAKEAANYYTSVFKGKSKILGIDYYPENAGSRKKGEVMLVHLSIMGQYLLFLNGGPEFKHSGAMSLVVLCKTQKEIDYYWEALTRGGGQKIECGWVMDKYGVHWQITPEILMKLLKTKKGPAAFRAMSQMKKLDIKKIVAAAK
jgi:predicted 3-demethylubiquinone-9 3-methyltransferase (glyoxalase superfamily)